MRLSKGKKIIISLLIILLAGISLFLFREFVSNYFVRLNMGSIGAPGADSRVLVFSPHNDDEALGAGELIKNIIKNGGKVKIVFITNGDGYKQAIQLDYFNINPKPKDFIKFGYTRQKESISALEHLGLSEKDIIFLGYPDGGVSFLWNAHWDKDEPYVSSRTQTDKSPYINSYTRGAAYTGVNLASDISKIVQEYKPTHIILPHPDDRHPDHWSTNAFVKYVLTQLNYSPKKEWMYLVHRGDWPTPMKTDASLYLVPPAKLVGTGTDWYAFELTNNDIKQKYEVLHLYKTQMRIIGPLLNAFVRKNELLGEYPDLKIVKNRSNDNEVQPNDSNRVIIDPTNDAIKLELTEGSDLSGVYAEISKQNNLHVFIEADGNIENITNYRIALIFFNGTKASRLNLLIDNRKLSNESNTKESITDISGCQLNVQGKFIHIVIPNSVTGTFNHVFINANSSIEDKLLDKTAWRMINN